MNKDGVTEVVGGRTKIFLVSSIEVSLRYAVGPSGKCTKVMASSQLVIRCSSSGSKGMDTHLAFSCFRSRPQDW